MKNRVLIYLIVIQAGLFSLALTWGKIQKIYWWRDLSFGGHFGSALIIGLILFLLAFGLFKILAKFKIFHIPWMIDRLLYPLALELTYPQMVLLAAISGLAEECLFRGILPKVLGILLANLIFGLLHTGSLKLWFAGVWAFLCGYLFSLLYAHTGSLGVVVFIHILYNGLGLVYLSRFYRPKGLEMEAMEKQDSAAFLRK